MEKHILVDISSHGFGHVAQTAPIVNALFARFPGLGVTIRTGVPRAMLESRFDCPFELLPESSDFGMAMKNAIDVDVAETAARYEAFHRKWDDRVEAEASLLRDSAFDLVLCNVSYLALKAASRIGMPAVACCSINWADLYWHYCRAIPDSEIVHFQILDAYRSAQAFLKVEPCMPMKGMGFARKIGPIAKVGRNRREEIGRLLGLKGGESIGLVSMGGIFFDIPFRKWPASGRMRWLVPEEISRADMTPFESLGMPFCDLLASCDVLVTKPGYGSFAEAAMSGVAVLYLPRGDWPEEPFLVEWLKKHGRCLEVGREALASGDISDELDLLFRLPERSRPSPTGIAEAADYLGSLLTAT